MLKNNNNKIGKFSDTIFPHKSQAKFAAHQSTLPLLIPWKCQSQAWIKEEDDANDPRYLNVVKLKLLIAY